MNTRVRVPIRVNPAFVSERPPSAVPPEVADAAPPVMDRRAATQKPPSAVPTRPKMQDAALNTREAEEETLEMWRDRALRLQAEMENFRKRQKRLADERIAADRERLLRSFLLVADDLGRALAADGTGAESLRRGVDLTYRSLMRLMDQEGVEPIQAMGQPFDPSWHEAVSTVPHHNIGAAPETVAEVVQTGYRLGNRLLRPACVVVAT